MKSRFTIAAAVAALLAAAALACAAAERAPQAADVPIPVPAHVVCKDGQVVRITTIAMRTGLMTIFVAPNVCDRATQEEAPPQPRAPASSSKPTT